MPAKLAEKEVGWLVFVRPVYAAAMHDEELLHTVAQLHVEVGLAMLHGPPYRRWRHTE